MSNGRKYVFAEGTEAKLFKIFLQKVQAGWHGAKLRHPLAHLVYADEINTHISDLAVARMIGRLHGWIVEHHVLSERLPERHCPPIHLVHEPSIAILFHAVPKPQAFIPPQPVWMVGVPL